MFHFSHCTPPPLIHSQNGQNALKSWNEFDHRLTHTPHSWNEWINFTGSNNYLSNPLIRFQKTVLFMTGKFSLALVFLNLRLFLFHIIHFHLEKIASFCPDPSDKYPQASAGSKSKYKTGLPTNISQSKSKYRSGRTTNILRFISRHKIFCTTNIFQSKSKYKIGRPTNTNINWSPHKYVSCDLDANIKIVPPQISRDLKANIKTVATQYCEL